MYISPVSFSGKITEFSQLAQLNNNSKKNSSVVSSSDVFVKSNSEEPIKFIESLDDSSKKLRGLVKNYRERTVSPEIIADNVVAILRNPKTKASLERELNAFDTCSKEEIDIEPIERFYDLLSFLSENFAKDLPDGNKKVLTMLAFEPYDDYYETYAKKYFKVFGDDEEFLEEKKSLTGRPLILNSLVDLEAGRLSKEETKLVYKQITDGLKDAFSITDKPEFQVAVEISEDFDVKDYTHAFKTFMKLVSDARKEVLGNKK